MGGRIQKAIASGGFGICVTMLTQLMLVPVFLSAWGVDRYAVWLIVFSVPAYLSMSDFGLLNVLCNRAQKYYSRSRKSLCADYLLSTALFIFPLALIFPALVYGLLFCFYPFENFYFEIFPVFSLLSIYSSFVILAGYVSSTLRVVKKFHWGSFFFNLLRFGDFLCILIALSSGGDELNSVFLLVVFRSIGTALVCYIHYRLLKPVYEKRPRAFKFRHLSLLRLNLRASLLYFLFPFSNMMSNQGVIFFAGISLSPRELVFFSTSRVLFRFPMLIGNVLSNSWRQEIADCFFRDDSASFLRLRNSLFFSTCFLIFIFAVSFLFFGADIYNFWLGQVDYFNYMMFLFLMAPVFIATAKLPNMMLLVALNKHEQFAWLYFSSVAVAMAFVSISNNIAQMNSSLLIFELVSYFLVSRYVSKNVVVK